MPSFKLWFVLAVLFAIAFSSSTVLAEQVPSDKEIVGSWKVTIIFDPKKWKAASADQKEFWEKYREMMGPQCDEIRADGTLLSQYGEKDEKIEYKRTWKLVDKQRKKLVLNHETPGESTHDLTWISKDEFTISFTIDKTPKEIFGLVTGLHYQRKKVAPKP